MYKILIVDDDDGVRDSLAFHFEDCDYDVTTAISGDSATPLITSGDFDIAIVDLRLPKLRGDDFIRSVYDKSEPTRFIIYTGSEEYVIDKDMKKLDRLCKKVFYKPVEDLMILNREIEKLMES